MKCCIVQLISGTERCYEALQKLGENYDIVVNIQGDEPLIEPEIIDGVAKSLQVFSCFSLMSLYVFLFFNLILNSMHHQVQII